MIQLAAAQRRLAREYGYRNWSDLIRHVKSLSAAYKATRQTDEATGATPLEAGPALKILWKRPVADLPLDPNIVDGDFWAEAPDLMRIRLRVLDQVGDTPELLELYEKLGLRFARLELEKDHPFLPLRDLPFLIWFTRYSSGVPNLSKRSGRR